MPAATGFGRGHVTPPGQIQSLVLDAIISNKPAHDGDHVSAFAFDIVSSSFQEVRPRPSFSTAIINQTNQMGRFRAAARAASASSIVSFSRISSGSACSNPTTSFLVSSSETMISSSLAWMAAVSR